MTTCPITTADFSSSTWIREVVVGGFWSQVDKRGADECWPWTGSTNYAGYGYVSFLRTQTGSHRIAYELTRGAIPAGLFVLHSCDNPPCCNPAHLRAGTHADNAADRAERRRGRGRPRVLTAAQAIEIRHRADEMSAGALARVYGVGRGSIHAILRGETYREVLPPAAAAKVLVPVRARLAPSRTNQPGTSKQV